MKKIPTVFRRDPDDMRKVLDEVTSGCEWVWSVEAVPTRKYDGTCFAKLENFGWAARREVKPGKAIPNQFLHIGTDETTGKAVGWEPAHQSPFAKMWREATEGRHDFDYGTYELCGPKINGNPEGYEKHTLVAHADAEVLPRNLVVHELIDHCRERGYEGVVWHHPDGRMAKLKVRDTTRAETARQQLHGATTSEETTA